MIDLFKKYLSTSTASILCFMLALLAKLGMIRIFLSIGNDSMVMLATTKNWLQGRGLSIASAPTSDLSITEYIPYVGWPPGINFHLAPLIFFFEENYALTIFLVLVFASVIFLWQLRNLLQFINLPAWSINLFLIFQGTYIGEYVRTVNPTDYLGMVYLMSGIYQACRLLYEKQFNRSTAVLAILFLSLAAITRYQYVPVVLGGGVFMIILGILNRNRQWIRRSLLITVINLLIILVVIIYFISRPGAGDYPFPAERGFFPQNLMNTNPFVLSTFIDVNFYAIQSSSALNVSYSGVFNFFILISFFLLVGLAFLFGRWIWKTRARITNATSLFFLIAGVFASATVLLLFLFSLVFDSDVGPPLVSWTFVKAGRYFAFPVIIIQIICWWWLVSKPKRLIFEKIGMYLMFLFITIFMAHGFYFIIKNLNQLTPIVDIPFKDKEVKYLRDYINEHKRSGNQNRLIVSGLNKLPCYVSNWNGISSFYDAFSLNSSLPSSRVDAELLVLIYEKDKKWMTEFIRREEVKLIYSTDQFKFYRVFIKAK